jgi:transcription antitermination factor NusG
VTTNYKIGDIVDFVTLIDRAPIFPELAEPRWFCAVTNPNCQNRAELELYALGFRTFTPKLRKWISHARVKKAVERPLLGRYLFVEIDEPRQSFHAVRAVNGVEGFITNLGKPAMIPEHYVESFRMRQMAGEWDEIAKGPIPVGARIRIMEGEFANMLATVTARKSGKLTLKLLDRNSYGRVHESSVRAA